MILGKKVSTSSVSEGVVRQPTMKPSVTEGMVKQSNLLVMIQQSMTLGKKDSKSLVLEGAKSSSVVLESTTRCPWS